MGAPIPLQRLVGGGRGNKKSPVTGQRIIGGLVPCNAIPDEILTDHPGRTRAMWVETANPAHSLADSTRMREALQSLDLLVVIDIAITETARLADYILPVATQFEKAEAAGFEGEGPGLGNALFDKILASPTAVVFAKHSFEDSWNRIELPDGKINAAVPELFASRRGWLRCSVHLAARRSE